MDLSPFEPNKCDLCGDCFAVCPVVDMDREAGGAEMKRLIGGGRGGPVLSRCISCFACSAACPKDLNVYGYVLSLWNEGRRGTNVPWHVRLALPEQTPPNPWTEIEKAYSPEERRIFDGLGKDVRGGEALFLGCNQLLNPYVAASPLFEGLPIVGAPGVCCGEPYFRTGFLDAFKLSAARWLAHWRKRAPARLIIYCTACYNMFTRVYPAVLGEEAPFEMIGVMDWIEERMGAGAVEIKSPLDRKVAIQDSCHARSLGKDFSDTARSLIEKTGATLIEPEGPLGLSNCCGFAAAARRFNPLDMWSHGTARVRDAKELGADEMAAYCNGCVLMLTFSSLLSPWKTRARHVTELVELAAGMEVKKPHRQRALRIIPAVTRVAAAKILRPSSNRLVLGADQ